jgi:N-acetyl-alpha-D-muramate 1-phosphate uridylyltransferase
MIAMILAAGRGKRLRPLTDTLPKALVAVAGESLLERHLRMLVRSGISNAVINVDWLGEQIVECIGDGHRFGVQVVYSPEFGGALETAGGIRRALPMLGNDPFWVVNADVYVDMDLPTVRLAEDVLAHVLLVPTPAFKSRGDFDLEGGKLANGEHLKFTFSGIALYRPEFFRYLPPGVAPLAPMLRDGAQAGKIAASLLEGIWEDVGTPERLERVRNRFGDQSETKSP